LRPVNDTLSVHPLSEPLSGLELQPLYPEVNIIQSKQMKKTKCRKKLNKKKRKKGMKENRKRGKVGKGQGE
jgi:hypothetical protein